VYGNEAFFYGGGIYGDVQGCDIQLMNSEVFNNRVGGVGGGGIYLGRNAALQILNSTVYGNIASSQGGGIHGDQGCVLLQLINSKVYGNRISQGGDDIDSSCSATQILNSAVGICSNPLCLFTCNASGYVLSGPLSCNVTGPVKCSSNIATPATCNPYSSEINANISTQCSALNVSNVVVQGVRNVSSQIEIPSGCNVTVTGTNETILSGLGSIFTRHFWVKSGARLHLISVILEYGNPASDGVSTHTSQPDARR